MAVEMKKQEQLMNLVDDHFYTANEAMTYLSIGRATLWRLIYQKKALQCSKLRGKLYFLGSELRRVGTPIPVEV